MNIPLSLQPSERIGRNEIVKILLFEPLSVSLKVLHSKLDCWKLRSNSDSWAMWWESLTDLKRSVLCCVLSYVDSLWSFGWWPASFLYPWVFSGKNTGVGCHFLLQGIFPTQGLSSYLLCLLHWQTGSLPLASPGKPFVTLHVGIFNSWYKVNFPVCISFPGLPLQSNTDLEA